VTEDEREKEGAEEQVEDLQAPAEAQDDVAGGAGGCSPPTCGKPSVRCGGNTCVVTDAYCTEKSKTHDNVVYEQ
jgi:hypothetical protein